MKALTIELGCTVALLIFTSQSFAQFTPTLVPKTISFTLYCDEAPEKPNDKPKLEYRVVFPRQESIAWQPLDDGMKNTVVCPSQCEIEIRLPKSEEKMTIAVVGNLVVVGKSDMELWKGKLNKFSFTIAAEASSKDEHILGWRIADKVYLSNPLHFQFAELPDHQRFFCVSKEKVSLSSPQLLTQVELDRGVLILTPDITRDEVNFSIIFESQQSQNYRYQIIGQNDVAKGWKKFSEPPGFINFNLPFRIQIRNERSGQIFKLEYADCALRIAKSELAKWSQDFSELFIVLGVHGTILGKPVWSCQWLINSEKVDWRGALWLNVKDNRLNLRSSDGAQKDLSIGEDLKISPIIGAAPEQKVEPPSLSPPPASPLSPPSKNADPRFQTQIPAFKQRGFFYQKPDCLVLEYVQFYGLNHRTVHHIN